MTRIVRRILGTLMLAAGVSAAVADSLEDVKKKLRELDKSVNSYTARSVTEVQMEVGDFRMKSRSEGVMEWMRDGDRYLMRAESRDESSQTTQGQEQKSRSVSTSVLDGQHFIVLTEMLEGPEKGKKTAVKSKYDPDAFKTHQTADLFDDPDVTHRLLPDEKVDGADCWVVESARKKGAEGAGAGRVVWHLRKDCGISVKMVSFDDAGKPVSTTVTSDLKLNPSLSRDRFKLEIPPGVEVMDLSNLAGGGAGQQPEAGKAAPADDEPRADDEEPKADKPKAEGKDAKPKKKLKLPKLP